MENSGGFSHDFFWNNGELYTEVIQVGSEKNKDEENVGHTDALPISTMYDSPRPYFSHQNRACSS